jgi:peptidoglycan/LPS O-acetylase OafA/YrhL
MPLLFQTGPTLARALAENNGVGKGFDFLRIALAILILATHSILVVTGDFVPLHHDPAITYVWGSLVPMFFTLSGYLVTASALRLSLYNFIQNRIFRIVPALAMDICLSALVLGPFLTTHSLASYFSDAEFWKYFRNIVGLIHYTLPGVFETNPFARQINGSLWTIPFELGCYLIMSILIVSGLLKRRVILLLLSLALASALAFMHPDIAATRLQTNADATILQNLAEHFLAPRGAQLYLFFLMGSLLFLYSDKIPFTYAALSFSLTAIFALGLIGAPRIAASPFLAYITIFIGLSAIPPIPIFRNGDYSYGVYLYSFPIQQSIIWLSPHVSVAGHFALSLGATMIFAMVSWHLVERPALKMRGKFTVKAATL